MTSITLRPRRPLESLPLAQYSISGLGLPPSPVSIPSKRSLNASPSRHAESSTSKARKVSADEGGVETIRRKRSDLTQEAKAALSRDEFGTGKSPARRLFVDTKTSFGISGATLTAPSSPSSPSRRLDFSTTPTNSPGPSRLAPSPPISSKPAPVEHENGATVNVHDIGFDIHADAMSSTNLGTPDSRPHRAVLATPAPDAARHLPSSPASVVDDNNDQENIAPPQQTPSRSSCTSSASNTRSPLSKSSISGSASSARFLDDASLVHLTGSGRNKIRERSRLNEVFKHAGSDDAEEELTPGRTRPADKGKGKARLSSEVNII